MSNICSRCTRSDSATHKKRASWREEAEEEKKGRRNVELGYFEQRDREDFENGDKDKYKDIHKGKPKDDRNHELTIHEKGDEKENHKTDDKNNHKNDREDADEDEAEKSGPSFPPHQDQDSTVASRH